MHLLTPHTKIRPSFGTGPPVPKLLLRASCPSHSKATRKSPQAERSAVQLVLRSELRRVARTRAGWPQQNLAKGSSAQSRTSCAHWEPADAETGGSGERISNQRNTPFCGSRHDRASESGLFTALLALENRKTRLKSQPCRKKRECS